MASPARQMEKVKGPKKSKARLLIEEYSSKMNYCALNVIESLRQKMVSWATCVPTRGNSSFGATTARKGFKIKTTMTGTWADTKGERFLVSIVPNDLLTNISWNITCPRMSENTGQFNYTCELCGKGFNSKTKSARTSKQVRRSVIQLYCRELVTLFWWCNDVFMCRSSVLKFTLFIVCIEQVKE